MYLSLTEGQERVESFAVTGGRTLELCFAQYWSSLGEAELELIPAIPWPASAIAPFSGRQ